MRALHGACTQCASAALPARRPRQPRSAASTRTARAWGLCRSASASAASAACLLKAHTWLDRRCGVVSPVQRRRLQWDRGRGLRAVHAARCRLKQLVRRDAAPRQWASSRHKTEGAPGANAYGSGRAHAVSAGPSRCGMALRTAEHGGAAGCADALQRVVAICERRARLSSGGGGGSAVGARCTHPTRQTRQPGPRMRQRATKALRACFPTGRSPLPPPPATRAAHDTLWRTVKRRASLSACAGLLARRGGQSYQRPQSSRSHGAQRGEHSNGRALRSGACLVCWAADGQLQVNDVGASSGVGRQQPRSLASRSRRQRPRRATRRTVAWPAARRGI